MVAVLSGRETLGHLSSTLATARRELERLDRELQSTSDAVAQNRQRQARALKRLAAMRLDAIRQGEVVKRIDSADYEVETILTKRRDALATLHQNVSSANGALLALEERRNSVHDDVDVAATTLAEREAAVQAQLAADNAFQEQLERTRNADAIAVSAMEKAELAIEDRRQKGLPYESDELFMYLWHRHYGTSGYRANPFARLLDAWVARLCRFNDARANYWMLLEIPKRLQDHAERVRADADVELEGLQALEQAAAIAGGVDTAGSAMVEAEKRQDTIDEQIANAEGELRQLQTELGQFAAGDDAYMRQCLQVLAEAMERRDVRELSQLAHATMTVEDDEIVDELHHIRRRDSEYHDELRRNRELQREHLQRVQELEQVRQRFKRHRYDDVRSGFDKGDLLREMMGQVLGGAIRGNALWDVLRRYQHYRDVAGAWPDFGSGGIPRTGRRPPAHRPTWHWPGRMRSSRRRGGFSLPRGPRPSSRGRGGFRTGGGF